MKIKVSLFTSKIWRQYAYIVAVLSALSSFYFISVDIPDNQTRTYIICATIVLVSLYILVWMNANLKRRTKLNINGSSLIVKVGDIFEEKDLKVIACNEYFDTIADDILLSKSSLNGKYLDKLSPGEIAILDQNIASDQRLSDRHAGQNSRRRIGKKIKYTLGSIFRDDDYLLVAFTHFDENNRAVLSLKEYVSCLVNFWDEVDQIYAGRSVSLPLLGSGITRFKDAEVSPQELLSILVWSFRISRVKFRHPANASIVIHSSLADKINLFEVGS